MSDVEALEELAARARGGDAAALEAVARAVKDDVYKLALRMLGLRADAEDATQEILVQVITHLGQFRGESKLRTWVFAIASRHLLRLKKSKREELASFDNIEMLIARGDANPPLPPLQEAEILLLAEEVRLSCTQAMVLSLDRELRLSWIVAEIFELSGEDSAAVLGIEPATHRKRLSRARERLGAWMQKRCGLVSADAACNCRRQIPVASGFGVARLDDLQYAAHPEVASPRRRSLPQVTREAASIELFASALKAHPDYAAPERVIERIRALLRDGAYGILTADG